MTQTATSDSQRAVDLLVFTLDGYSYGLPLATVHRTIRAVEITLLPGAPAGVLGVINLQGSLVPVFDIRGRFRLPVRALAVSDQLVIAGAGQRTVALLVDSVAGVFRYSREVVDLEDELFSELPYVRGVVKLESGMILIHDLTTFLSAAESAQLDRSLERLVP